MRTLDTDVAIVGSGGAGLMCVLHLAKNAPELDVTVVSKGAIARSGCTRMVQGGYNAVLDPADSLELHFRDTLEGGKYLNDQEMAWTLVNGAPRTIEELESGAGCFFDRTDDGRIRQKAFGGQNFDRTVHKGDLTGMEIMGKLLEQMERIRPRELGDTRALDLLFDGDGELAGLTVLDVMTGEVYVLRARVVVVAAGGPATMYKIAAPAREKTGDGVAMCFRAGLELRDMEMLQFHPTGLLAGESVLTGAVLEEGLRGAGAHMYNAEGERFMERYDPERMERSTRDVVSRASYLEIMAGRGTPRGGVMLDISHLGPEEVERRFPGMTSRSRIIGSDLARGPIEVSPTAHFHMGGVIVDRDCQTTIPGLLVAGEDSGGVHGANRLGGNGVAESTIFGGRAGDRAALTARERGLRDPDPTQVGGQGHGAAAGPRHHQPVPRDAETQGGDVGRLRRRSRPAWPASRPGQDRRAHRASLRHRGFGPPRSQLCLARSARPDQPAGGGAGHGRVRPAPRRIPRLPLPFRLSGTGRPALVTVYRGTEMPGRWGRVRTAPRRVLPQTPRSRRSPGGGPGTGGAARKTGTGDLSS
jgi:succinate dehydrogenase/fumarate reductase flavoprotein subunit